MVKVKFMVYFNSFCPLVFCTNVLLCLCGFVVVVLYFLCVCI